MDYYTEATYGDRIANVYDQWYNEFDPTAISRLAELARGGRALELGIGTGRIALPLVKAGVAVEGIDISTTMVDRLRSKPGGEGIPVTMGNFADVNVEGQYSLIYVVFNTFYSLLTQEEQVKCFQNVASHLASNGVFVLETFVPDLTRFTAGQAVRLTRIGENEVHMDVTLIETDKQVTNTQHMMITDHETRFFPVKLRFTWPSEMDLMARLSHLQLVERWSDWEKSPFTSASRMYISIYGHQN